MAEVSKLHQDRLDDLKTMVRDGYEYFLPNYRRYQHFMKLVFKTSLTSSESKILADMGRPNLEFNSLEAIINKLRGEFAKQQPSVTVRAADGLPANQIDESFCETQNVIESHMKAVLSDSSNDMLDYAVYTDLLAGGFSAVKITTDYVSEKSFEQNIIIDRVFDPCMTVFDPLARKSHKGDGSFVAELFPITKKKFELDYGKEAADGISFVSSLGDFDWSYSLEGEDVLLVCDLYEKKNKKEKILKLSNGHTVTKKEYDKFLKEWDKRQFIEQPPIPVQERMTTIETIVRYRFCENKVLDYVETSYKYLPIVFVDGNSVIIKDSAECEQMTRPYVYQAEGILRLKNFAGQSLAGELESSVQHKIVSCIEALPDEPEYLNAYRNVQQSDVLLYKNFLDKSNPNVVLPPPMPIARTPIPPEIINTFMTADQQIGNILGNYDQNAGLNSANVSGLSFARSTIQSNSAATPYLVGYLRGLNRVAQIIVDLIPKYYRTPRSLPIINKEGKRTHVDINKKNSLYMNYDPDSLNVKVEAGVNFAMQKEISLQTVIQMSQANQGFAQFFNEEGLPVLLDNIDIRGIDQLKHKANKWMEKQKQQQEQAQQAQQQQMQMQAQQQAMQMAALQKEVQSPSQTKVESMYLQQKAQTEAANLAIKAQDSETKFMDVMSKIDLEKSKLELSYAEKNAEQMRKSVETSVKLGENISGVLNNNKGNGNEETVQKN